MRIQRSLFSILAAFTLLTAACNPFEPPPSPTGHNEAGGVDDASPGAVSIQKGGLIHTFAPDVHPGNQQWHIKAEVLKCLGETALCTEGQAYEKVTSEGNT